MVHLLFLAKDGIVCIYRTLLAIIIHIKNISIFYLHTCVNQDSSVRVMGYGLSGRGTIPSRDKRFFLYCTASRLALKPMRTGVSFPRGKVAVAGSWPLTLSSAEVKNGGALPALPHTLSWCGTASPFFNLLFTYNLSAFLISGQCYSSVLLKCVTAHSRAQSFSVGPYCIGLDFLAGMFQWCPHLSLILIIGL